MNSQLFEELRNAIETKLKDYIPTQLEQNANLKFKAVTILHIPNLPDQSVAYSGTAFTVRVEGKFSAMKKMGDNTSTAFSTSYNVSPKLTLKYNSNDKAFEVEKVSDFVY